MHSQPLAGPISQTGQTCSIQRRSRYQPQVDLSTGPRKHSARLSATGSFFRAGAPCLARHLIGESDEAASIMTTDRGDTMQLAEPWLATSRTRPPVFRGATDRVGQGWGCRESRCQRLGSGQSLYTRQSAQFPASASPADDFPGSTIVRVWLTGTGPASS